MKSVGSYARSLALALSAVFLVVASAEASTWTKLVGGNASGSWGDGANWSGGLPNATNAMADFSTLNIAVNSTVTNEVARTVGTLKFGDTSAGSNWSLTNSTLTLATTTGAPFISVAGSDLTATLGLGLAGSQGFAQSGGGTLVLAGGTNNMIAGSIVITNGQLKTVNGAALKNVAASITVLSGAVLNLNASFDGNANSCPIFLNGNGDGMLGALHGDRNQTLNGLITLNSNSKISHDFNNFTLTGGIVGANKNLELHSAKAGQPGITVSGNVQLGSGILTKTGPSWVSVSGSNTLGGVMLAEGTVFFSSGDSIGCTNVTVAAGAVAALNGNDLNPLLTRVTGGSAGAIALNASSSSTALNFGAVPNLSLGSVGSSTYSGPLTPGGGNYQLGGGGGALTVSTALTNAAAGLVINGNASNDVVVLTGARTFGGTTTVSGGTLVATGTLTGPVVVQAGGTLSPGPVAGLGALTVSNAVTLGGTTLFGINRTSSPNADVLSANSLVLGGTLSVTNLGGPLQLGDSFQLFNVSGAISNASLAFNLPTLSGGLRWDVGQLAVNGVIQVVPLDTVGETNFPSLLLAEITSAYQAGYSNVTINPGTYVMPNGTESAFLLNGWTNFTINASNAVFTVDSGRCFELLNCSNVTIQGATVIPRTYPFTQGLVIAIGTNSGVLFCDWQISAGYPTNGFQWWFNAVYASNLTVNLVQDDIYFEGQYGTNSAGVANNASFLGNRTWRLRFPGWLTSFSFQTNDWLVARYDKQGFSFFLNGSTNCTIQDCVSMSGGFAQYRENLGGGNRLLRCRIQPSPFAPPGGTEPPVVSSSADGVHTTRTYPGLHIEDCIFTGVFLDDHIAIHGSFENVVGSTSNTNVVTFDGLGMFAVGDPVRISSSNGTYLVQANCTAIQNLGNGNYQLTLNQSFSVPAGSVGSNPKYGGSGYKIINCQLSNVRSRSIICKADDGLISGNLIQNAQEAIKMGPEIFWNESDYVWNVTITNNTILNCGNAGIWITGNGALGNKNITIRDNYFENVFQGSAIELSECRSVTVAGNTFVKIAAGNSPVSIATAADIVLLENLATNNPSGVSLVNVGSGVTGLSFATNGIYLAGPKLVVSKFSGLYLDGGTSPVVQSAAASVSNPVFTLSPVGNGYSVLQCGGQVLDVAAATNAGTSLQATVYTGGDGQLWRLLPVGTTNVLLVNKLSGLAANVSSLVSGTTVIQSVIDTNASSQQWSVLTVPANQAVWDGGGANNNWNTANNWVGNTLPGWLASLTFAGSTRLANTNNLAGTTANGITFSNGAGAFILSGNGVNLGGNIINNSTNVQTVNLPLVLSANRFVNPASNNLVLGGTVSGAFKLIQAADGGTVTLNTAGSSFDGYQINRGTTRLGANDALPASNGLTFATATSATLDLNGKTQTIGTVTFGGTAGTAAITDTAGGGLLKLGGNVTQNADGTPTVNIAAAMDLNGATRTLTLNNASGTITVTGPITNSTGTAGLTKAGVGTLILAGTNSYNGNTTINGGTLQLNVASLNTNASVIAANNAVLNLNFPGTNLLSAIFTNGVPLPDGVYNASNLSGLITGGGSLRVGAVPASAPGNLVNVVVSGGSLIFSVTNSSGTYRVQASTNLANTGGWVDIATNTAPFSFTNSMGAKPQQFFRTVTP